MVHIITLLVVQKPESRSLYSEYATGWTVWVSNPVGGKIFFCPPKRPDRLWGSHSLLFNAYRGLFLGVKRPGCEVNQSPSSSAEVKIEWNYTSTVLICLHSVDRETFTFVSIMKDVEGSVNDPV
jgi:hypothetical protein